MSARFLGSFELVFLTNRAKHHFLLVKDNELNNQANEYCGLLVKLASNQESESIVTCLKTCSQTLVTWPIMKNKEARSVIAFPLTITDVTYIIFISGYHHLESLAGFPKVFVDRIAAHPLLVS